MKHQLVVVYDVGAAGPVDIATAAHGTCDIVFVCDPANPNAARHLDQMHQSGTVVAISDPSPADISRVVQVIGADGITTFSEFQLELTAAAAAECGLRFHDPSVIRLLTDKSAQRSALRAAGVDATRNAAVDSLGDLESAVREVGLPAVLKPRKGAASAETHLVPTIEDAERVLRDAGGRFVLEELLVGDPAAAGQGWGDFVSVESVVADGTVKASYVTGKLPLAPPFRETGQFAPSTLDGAVRDRVAAYAEAAVAALGVRWGAVHTEVKLTPQGPRIVEVNGRLGGYVGDVHLRAGGPDLLRDTIAVALGLPAEERAPAYRQVAFRHYLAAPPYRARLVRLDGIDDLLRLPGVTHVDLRAEPGRVLDWRKGTQECLAVVYGTAPDHRALARTIRRIAATVRPRYASAQRQPSEEIRS
jgi:biotin carboxylase